MAEYQRPAFTNWKRMPKTNFAGEYAPVGSGGYVGSGVIQVDLGPAVKAIRGYLARFSDEIQRRALYNAMNHEGDKLLTQVRRVVAHQAGVSYGEAMKAITSRRAHPGRLEYRLDARGTPFRLAAFASGLKPGMKDVKAAPWNKPRVFKDTFVIAGKDGPNIVKRVGKHEFSKGRGPLKARAMWGPIIPHEMIRRDSESLTTIVLSVPEKFIPRVLHEVEQASIRAGAK